MVIFYDVENFRKFHFENEFTFLKIESTGNELSSCGKFQKYCTSTRWCERLIEHAYIEHLFVSNSLVRPTYVNSKLGCPATHTQRASSNKMMMNRRCV